MEAFKKDTIGNTSANMLKKMTSDNPTKEILLERAKGRIPNLEQQLIKQRGELAKINEILGKDK